MSEFALGASNTHWGYGSAASAYSPYLASSGLSSCTTPTSAQFNNPALGFTCSSNDQSNNQDFGGATNRDCVPSKLVDLGPCGINSIEICDKLHKVFIDNIKQ